MKFLSDFLLGEYSKDGAIVREYGIPTPCSEDLIHRNKICYAQTLRFNGDLLVQVNGCDDYFGGKACTACIKNVEDFIRQKEA